MHCSHYYSVLFKCILFFYFERFENNAINCRERIKSKATKIQIIFRKILFLVIYIGVRAIADKCIVLLYQQAIQQNVYVSSGNIIQPFVVEIFIKQSLVINSHIEVLLFLLFVL